MKGFFKKAISITLTAVIIFGAAPLAGLVGLELPEFNLFGTKAEAATSGTCGDNLTWTLDETTGELVISGTGAMNDYSTSSYSPWYSYRASIKTVNIADGVTRIGKSAFCECTSLKSVTIPDSVTSIGGSAFYNTSYYNNTSNWENDVLYIEKYLISAKTTISGSYNVKEETSIVADYAFFHCEGLTSVTIPDSVTNIGDSAFNYCDSLTSVTIGNGVTSIGRGAFYYCRRLTSITIPDSVTNIGDSAFNECYYLSNVTISDNVTSIGKSAFCECTRLKSVTIPDSVTSIGDSAFSGCQRLTSVTIGNGVTSIGNDAFDGCVSLTNITVDSANTVFLSDEYGVLFNENKTTLIQYPQGNTRTSYVIPDSVTSIGNSAFSNCDYLTSIIMPDSITSIGVKAFNSCNNLTSVTIPDGAIIIGDSAFSGCNSLTSVTIPDGVTNIGERTFYGCDGLTTVTIGNGVTSIGYGAFYACYSLTDVFYTGSQEQWKKVYILSNNDDLKNSSFVFECNSETPYYIKGTCGENLTWILHTNGELVISGTGEMTDWINDTAPWDSIKLKIKSVKIEEGVTSIGNKAFNSCDNLTSVTIPDSVTSIGGRSFYSCTNLTSVTIGSNVTSIGEEAFYNTAYYNNASNWENDVLYIGKYLIDTQKTISGSYKVKEGTSVIADSAFEYRNSLENITLPDSITNIGSGAFTLSNAYFTNIYYEGEIADWCKIKIAATNTNPMRYTRNFYVNGVLLKELVIPDGITSIDFCSFYYCKNITTVTIPKSVKAIKNYAFDGCSGIETIYYYGTADEWQNVMIGTNNEYLLNAHVVYEYGTENAYYGSGTIGSTITWILYENGDLIIEGSGAIPNYSESSVPWYAVRDRIKNVYIPEEVTNIGASAFVGCTNIEKFIVDENNVSFVSDEFGVLYNLDKTKLIKYPAKSTHTEYIIPESVESIRPKAFEQAKNLTSITLNTNITEICDSAFIGCTNLVAANYYGTQENWNTITVSANNEYLTNSLIYEFGTENSNYGKGTCGSNLTWVLYSNGSLVISGTGEMTNYYTATPAPWSNQCSKITSIKIPSGATTIGSSAFAHCTNLETVEIPSSVKSIGEVAFAECDKIKNISVPYGVKTIDGGAFRDCDMLESINIPDSVTTLGNSAFYMCDSLKNVTLSKNIKTIDDYTFYKCISLESIVIPDSVTYIGYYAFYNCTKLREITMPVTARIYNSSYVFGGCSLIKKVTLTKGTTGVMLDYGTSTSSSSTIPNYKYTPWYIGSSTEVIIGEGVKSIGDCAFYDSSALKNLTLPASLNSMGYMSFYNCSGIKNIYFTGTLADWCGITIDNVHPVNYTDNLYINGKLVEGDLVIPNGVTTIGVSAFGERDEITSVIIPDSVTSIGNNAFGGCDALAEVTIGNGVKTIGDQAFVMCPAMEKLIIGNSVTSIGMEAFYGCASLKELTIPVTAKIYNSADTFYGCDKLEKVTLTKGTTGIMQDYGTSSAEDAPLTHCCNTPWYMSDSCTEVIIEEGVKNIGDNAFRSCKKIKNIRIPSSVTSIGDNAFKMCYGLEKVTIPDAVTTIGDYAFNYCDGITELTMPVSAKIYNSENTFYGCYNIEKIIFTKGTGAMPDYGTSTSTSSSTTYYKYTPWYISGCTEIVLPKGVSTIGKYAFHECGNLTTVNYEGSSDEYYEILIKDYNNPLIFAKINFGSYTVKWICGNETKQETVRVGATIVLPTFEPVEGYSIVGWSSEIPDVMPAENLTFTAVLEAKSYNVEWNANATTTEDTYKYGQTISLPSAPEKTGYTFIGWTPEVPDVMPADDLSFTAVYVANAYDAIFDANGGMWADGSERKVETVEFDSEIIIPETPSKAGYIFSGWSCEDKNLGTDLGVMDVEGGKLFKAVWIASTDTLYTVETYIMNTEGEYEKSVQILNGATDSTVNAEYKVAEGFTFNEEKSVTSGIVSADNSLVLKVYIDRNTYSLTTIIDGVRESTEYFYGSIIPEIIPEKTGYTFVGWDNDIPATMPAKDLIITAEFDADSINAVFNANGGEWADGSTTKSIATDFDSKITVPENPARKGYDFVGWDSEIGIMDDVNGKSFNAVWTARNDTKYYVETYIMDVNGKYVVTSKENQGTTETEVSVSADVMEGFTFNDAKSVLSGTIAADGSLVLKIYYDRNKYSLTIISDGVSTDTKYYYEAKIVAPTVPVKTGHTFVEWSDELPKTMPAENISVEAVWQINTYTVSWVIDGKTTKNDVVYGETITAPEVSSKTGYRFVGWTPSVPAKMPANDVTFTAKYEPAIVMSIRNPSTTTISYGDKIILHADTNESLPSGWKIKWTADNSNFSYSASGDGSTCTISPSKSGDTTFTATVYDEKGNVISEDTQTMTSKAGFFDKIIAFFRGLFGGNKVIAQAFKGIF